MHRTAALAAFALLAACGDPGPGLATALRDTLPGGIVRVTSPGPTAWADSADPRAWRLVEAGRITGEPETPSELVSPAAVAVDEAGRVYVADQKPAVIKVFGPDNRFLHAIGKEGAGPGEFGNAFPAAANGLLVVHDPGQTRTSVFDTAGAFLRSWTSNCCHWSEIAIDASGLAYVPGPAGGDEEAMFAFARYTTDGAVRDTVAIPVTRRPRTWTFTQGRERQFSMPVPFEPQDEWALHPEGGFVRGYGDRYAIVRSPTGRDTALVFGRDWAAEPIPEAMKLAAVERRVGRMSPEYSEAALREAFRAADIGSTAPAFHALHVDRQGNTWARVGVESDSVPPRFDVFGPDGAWLGSVQAPARMPMYPQPVFGRDEMLVITEDADGMPAVVRYRIERGSGT